MTRTRLALALAASLITPIAEAQVNGPAAAVTVLPAQPAKWDAAIYATWLGERRLDSSFDSDRWYGVASGGAQIGYHWTSHLKVELDAATSSQGESYSFEVIPVPGSPTPLYLQRSHDFRATTASAGLEYQFFENAWFHPLVGAGLELLREREHIETTFPAFSTRDPRATAMSPQP
jgi:opacity protein-like surface antigen